jgi:hypothetical protein
MTGAHIAHIMPTVGPYNQRGTAVEDQLGADRQLDHGGLRRRDGLRFPEVVGQILSPLGQRSTHGTVGVQRLVEGSRTQRRDGPSEQRETVMLPITSAPSGPIGGPGLDPPPVDPLARARDKAPSALSELRRDPRGELRPPRRRRDQPPAFPGHGPTIPATAIAREPAGRSRHQQWEIGRRWLGPLGGLDRRTSLALSFQCVRL